MRCYQPHVGIFCFISFNISALGALHGVPTEMLVGEFINTALGEVTENIER